MSGPDLHDKQLYCLSDDCEGLLLIQQTYQGWRTMYADGHMVTRPDGIQIIALDPNSTGNDDVNVEESHHQVLDKIQCSQCDREYDWAMTEGEL